MNKVFDFIIIGSGVIGSAIARELAKYKYSSGQRLQIGVLEKNLDVCRETSGRNSGVLHAGFNNRPGSKMAKLCVAGNRGFDKVAAELSVPFKRTGKVVVGFNDKDKNQLLALIDQGKRNGIADLDFIQKSQLQMIAPNISGEFAMYSPSTAILDPFQLTIGLAENAYKNGVRYYFGRNVYAIDRIQEEYLVHTTQGDFVTRWLINSAGLGADKISEMVGISDYKIYPCRGEYYILDKNMGDYLSVPAYPVPNPAEGGLGIHLTPTIDGNIMIGPSAEYIDENDNYASTRRVMDMLLREGSRIFPYIKQSSVIRSFTGIRPKLVSKEQGGYADFIIEIRDNVPSFVNLVGMESPGLTSSTPIAQEVIAMIREHVSLIENEEFDPVREKREVFRDMPIVKQEEYIRKDADYGEIICRCEQVTKAEILNAIRNPLGVHTLAGIKVRCRAMMGRCQGGYCESKIVDLICQELNIVPEKIKYTTDNSYMFTGKIRG